MPYRIDPSDDRCVQVQSSEGWERLNCHDTQAEATAHLTALNLNVEEKQFASGEFQKIDAERQIAFGWAYTAAIGDKLVVDHSGDFVDEEAIPFLEDAVYEFVLESREADEMHERFTGVGKIVESVLFTPEKMKVMGIEGERIGWWVGFFISDEEVWGKVKDGTYPAFSVRGLWDKDEPSDATAN
jgi:hypothetical protein